MKKIQLSVPKPCHEQWQHMTPKEQGRFCAACQKTVVDFTSMSEAALIRFFEKATGNVCGRFQPQQLERALVKPRMPLPFMRYFFQITLPALLVSLKATAQEKLTGKVAVCQNSVQGDTVMQVESFKPTPVALASGKVTDEAGIGIAGAALFLHNSVRAISCDRNGVFDIYDTTFFQKPIRVEAIGYAPQITQLKKGEDTIITLSPALQGTLGMVVVGSVTYKPAKPIPVIRPYAKPQSHFSLFPNPIQAGSTLTINWHNLRKGNYVLRLQSLNGQTLWSDKIMLNAKNSTCQLSMPQLAAGIYLLTAVHTKTGTAYTEKIEVQ